MHISGFRLQNTTKIQRENNQRDTEGAKQWQEREKIARNLKVRMLTPSQPRAGASIHVTSLRRGGAFNQASTRGVVVYETFGTEGCIGDRGSISGGGVESTLGHRTGASKMQTLSGAVSMVANEESSAWEVQEGGSPVWVASFEGCEASFRHTPQFSASEVAQSA